MDHAALTIRRPQWDDGGLLWSDELEALYQKANEKGRAAVLLPEGDGFMPVILLGWRLTTAHREWIIRMSLVLSATDFPARFAINCQFQGEPVGQQMYPRLPFEWRRTGVVQSMDEVNPTLEQTLDEAEATAEQVHLEAVQGTRAAMRVHIDALLKPKPWWQFW